MTSPDQAPGAGLGPGSGSGPGPGLGPGSGLATDRWTPAELPDLSGVRALVTGANSGLGFQTALQLARHGAQVVLTARDPWRGDEALGQVRVQAPGASVRLCLLDLADLSQVRDLAAEMVSQGPLDLLVNNAGVMATPRLTTADGFELQLGTNHLGHFALTGGLLPALLRGGLLGGPARVVTVSSMLHRRGRLHRDDLMADHWYTPFEAYGQSKLANLLFTFELQRRAQFAGVALASLAAHPGYAATNLNAAGLTAAPGPAGGLRIADRVRALAGRIGDRLIAQPAAHGAWPSLRAAADPAARGGQFYGPGGFAEQRGHPRLVSASEAARDLDDAAWLWRRSAELTGVEYPALS